MTQDAVLTHSVIWRIIHDPGCCFNTDSSAALHKDRDLQEDGTGLEHHRTEWAEKERNSYRTSTVSRADDEGGMAQTTTWFLSVVLSVYRQWSRQCTISGLVSVPSVVLSVYRQWSCQCTVSGPISVPSVVLSVVPLVVLSVVSLVVLSVVSIVVPLVSAGDWLSHCEMTLGLKVELVSKSLH